MNIADANQTEVYIPIREESDVVMARQLLREAALGVELPLSAQEAMATAVSEIARNIIVHGVRGEIRIRIVARDARRGVEVLAKDNGPGIVDVCQALEDGYSTTNSLGLGLSSTMRLVDDFDIVSEPGNGTSILIRKWRT